MRRVLPLVAAAVALAAVSASAGTPVLDGKRAKSFAFTSAVGGPQQHLVAETYGTVDGVDEEVTDSCVAPRCYAFPFDVRPAKGVDPKTPISAKVTWGLRTTRLWVSLMDVTNAKAPASRADCYSFYVTNGTSAVVRAPSVKPGHKYAIWVAVQQSVAPDTLSGTVSFPGTDTPGANPGPSPSELFVNGCNS